MEVDITKRDELNTLLNKLTEKTEATWGVMQSQNMIEHLAKTLEFSNGKEQIAQRTTEQVAKEAKAVFIYTDIEMPKGLKSPLLKTNAALFEFSDLEEAKKNFNKELDDFEAFFAANPEATFIHPRLGSLNYKEWIVFHNKHFTHHFRQFRLI